MRKAFLAAAVAASAIATPVFAQEVDPTFTGPRIGVIGGYDQLTPGSTEDSDIDGEQKVDGFLYGVDIGYDFSIGGLVAGIEGEITDSTGKVRPDSANPGYIGFGNVSTGRDLYAGVRVGGLVTPRTLLYAKGGYTNQRLNVLASNGTTEREEQFNLDGWRIGAGLEHAVSNNVYAKVEYRYSNYSEGNFEFANGATTSSFDIDTDRHQVVAGVGFRF
jgi:outer membrane immunogenic protein